MIKKKLMKISFVYKSIDWFLFSLVLSLSEAAKRIPQVSGWPTLKLWIGDKR